MSHQKYKTKIEQELKMRATRTNISEKKKQNDNYDTNIACMAAQRRRTCVVAAVYLHSQTHRLGRVVAVVEVVAVLVVVGGFVNRLNGGYKSDTGANNPWIQVVQFRGVSVGVASQHLEMSTCFITACLKAIQSPNIGPIHLPYQALPRRLYSKNPKISIKRDIKEGD